MADMFKISPTAIEVAAWRAKLGDASAGACVTFEGWVRRRNQGREVHLLEYEAHVALAEAEGARILAEARERWRLLGCAAVHRSGRLALGELAFWVGVTAEHREAAFDGCRYIVDEAKKRLPIWKKEHYVDGAAGWINAAAGSEAERHDGSTPTPE